MEEIESFRVLQKAVAGENPAAVANRLGALVRSVPVQLVWITRLRPNLLCLARVVEPAAILRWQGSGATGVGNHDRGQGGRGLIAACVI